MVSPCFSTVAGSYIFFFFFSIGTGAFLRDPSVCGNLEDFHIWVGFNPTYELEVVGHCSACYSINLLVDVSGWHPRVTATVSLLSYDSHLLLPMTS
jgi:hypothetical protein